MNYRLPIISLLLVLLGALILIACESTTPEVAEEVVPPLIVDPPPDHAEETLAALLAADPPERDLADLAERLLGITVPTTSSASIPKEGDVDIFWYKQGGQSNVEVSAELQYQTEAINFWVEDGARVSQNDLEEAGRVLGEQIMPTTRSFFGTEETPGIDGDERINILHLKQIGGSGGGTTAVGYFYAADQYPKSVNEFSNERDIFYISLKEAGVASETYYDTIAHEFQHMVHAKTDRNEPAWSDEGLAELSKYVNGYTNVDSISSYAQLPDVQLNDWRLGTSETLAHYGSSFLFSAYFLERFGTDASKAVVASAENGFAGYEKVLTDIGANLTANELFADWVVANYLAGAGKGYDELNYRELTIPEIALAAEVDSFPAEYSGAVYQYGADYIKLSGDAPVTVEFTGSQQVSFMDTEPHGGDYFFTTLPADRSDMTMTREFDLTGLEPVTTTLNFWTWYEIESGWDYAYVLISADNGESWDQLSSIYSTRANPQGNNYGVALTGESGVNAENAIWAENIMDISDYVGNEVLIRFEYVTDDAVFEAGWAIDDISIPQLGYSEGFEDDAGGWVGAGFVRHANVLPQQYIIQAIYSAENDVRVEQLYVNEREINSFELDLDSTYSDVVLVISGSTPITSQRAAYELTIR